MKLISISEYNYETMQLAIPLYDKHRRVLLGVGSIIHPKYLNRIKELDIKYFFVEDAESQGITLDEIMNMSVWLELIDQLKNVYNTIDKTKGIDGIQLSIIARKLEEEILHRKILALVPTTTVVEELREYAHAINVSMIALMLGKNLKLTGTKIRQLVIGCLLHDVGKQFTNEYERHTVKGFDFLRQNRGISLISSHIAFQHHERFDGQGFPRGLLNEEIQKLSQICSIANIYDNLVSREQMLSHEAMERLMTIGDKEVSTDLIRTFVNTIPTYIPGTKVLLNNGQIGIVSKITVNLHRPTIRILDTHKEVCLNSNPTLLVDRVIIDQKEHQV